MAAVKRITAVWAVQIADLLDARGRQSNVILREVGLDPKRIRKENARIPYAKHAALLEAAACHLNDPCFALHFGSSIDPLDVGAVGYVVANSPTLGRAIKNFFSYKRVVNDGVDICLETKGKYASFVVEVIDPEAQRYQQNSEGTLVGPMQIFRFLVNKRIRAERVEYRHQRNEQVHEFEQFFGCKVKFRAKRTAITLDKSVLDLPCKNADTRLLKVLKAHCDDLVAKLGSEAVLKDQVEHLVSSQLAAGRVTANSVAKELGLSERTFARRLTEDGTTFGQIVEDVRRRLAERYIHESGAKTKQIAFMLGYSEPATFTNAFRRWTGKSPSEFRAEA